MTESEEDLLLGLPARQRELAALAKAQIEEQRRASDRLVQSVFDSADAIRHELAVQTSRIEEAILCGSGALIDAIDELGDRVAGELGEVRWELLQLRSVSEQALAVLKRPRSTEAQELLDQGMRNLINDKLDQAENRFRLALQLDNTDYQVLMNLSAVELRKGDAAAAVSFAHDALMLPADLDSETKANTLWHLSRIYYATEDYTNALRVARRSTGLEDSPRRIFQVGVYALLAGDLPEGLGLIERAIRQDARILSLAASASDLIFVEERVLSLLASLSKEVCDELIVETKRLGAKAGGVDKLRAISSTYVERFQRRFEWVVVATREGSYSVRRSALQVIEYLQDVPSQLKSLDDAVTSMNESEAALSRKRSEYDWAKVRVTSKNAGCWLSFGLAVLAQHSSVMSIIWDEALSPRHSPIGQAIMMGVPFFVVFGVASLIFNGRREHQLAELATVEADLRDLAKTAEGIRAAHGSAEQVLSVSLYKAEAVTDELSPPRSEPIAHADRPFST